MNLLDSTPTSKQLLDAGLADSTLSPAPGVTDTPSENWPYTQNKVPDGDEALIGKLLNVNPETNQPDTEAANWSLGAIAPISAVWTGAPLGVAWDLPSAAIQNAQGSFVPPTEAAAAAAEADATLASTSDPTTNNLVTFNASTTDASAYNNYLMVEDYLVVPTNGLPADKATKLAQFVRYALGTAGQQVISSFGVAPATPAMVTAGLKVAADLDTEALGGSSTSTSTTTTTTAASTTSTTTASSTGISTGTSTGASSSAGSQSDGSGGSSSSSGGSGPTLAFTGGNPLPLLGIGLVMVVAAVPFRRAFRRRRLPT
jgi:uncharacterized membrane protein YgcG